MFYHLVFDGVAGGPLGVALDVVASAAQLVRSGAVAQAGKPTCLDQKVVSVGGAPVRSRTGRPAAVRRQRGGSGHRGGHGRHRPR
ncbi:MAG: hypothetical protein IV100_07945 [Myxococcales bacterium]|nr:hypothetical protein [Myxococcales bacterium]